MHLGVFKRLGADARGHRGSRGLLKKAATAVTRPAERGTLEITVSPPQGAVTDAETAARYAELGVDRLVVIPPAGGDIEAVAEFVSRQAPAELGL